MIFGLDLGTRIFSRRVGPNYISHHYWRQKSLQIHNIPLAFPYLCPGCAQDISPPCSSQALLLSKPYSEFCHQRLSQLKVPCSQPWCPESTSPSLYLFTIKHLCGTHSLPGPSQSLGIQLGTTQRLPLTLEEGNKQLFATQWDQG